MVTHAQLTGAPAPLVFADGTEWRMSPLGDDDLAEINEWVRSQVMKAARLGLVDGMTASEREELLRAAVATASQISAETREGQRILATIDGWSKLVWQSVHRNHSEVTVELVRKKMLDPRNVQEAERVFNKQNVGDVPNGDSTSNAGKKANGPSPLNRHDRRAEKSKARR